MVMKTDGTKVYLFSITKEVLIRTVSFLFSLTQVKFFHEEITRNQNTLERRKTVQRLISPQIQHKEKCTLVITIN